ncbi:hypothetical protein HHK36_033232 [Tetracentron sinense]|uniref:Uncharacterized protein n=1 Tax=Tetracentron sinense TaxID=13715 RepID=A0A834Y7W7_TETSI|nr:hypothetical protein HHK36_033232 [Tetracentron sinense]
MSISLTSLASLSKPFQYLHKSFEYQRKWRIRSSAAAPGVDFKTLEAAIEKFIQFETFLVHRFVGLRLLSYYVILEL